MVSKLKATRQQLEPGMKRKAIVNRRKVVKAALLYIRLNKGVPANFAELVRYLKQQNIRWWAKRNESYGHTYNERTLRFILQERLGLRGKRGRKPNVKSKITKTFTVP